YRALEEGRQRVAAGERDVTAVRGAILAVLGAIPGVGVEYVAIVAPQTLEPLERIEGPARALIAARLGRVRLIDNISLTGEG
ncbi:MAG: pantoate--beta-alanine ligase, partial [Chloroflexota bacterium]|nr:pantoate--beta-alanine ligase [Chloroflexota bacterium]